MNSQFIKIKSLEGELKVSHKKKHFGMTVSTREFVLQKPHVNYHIKLENIISIVPFDTQGNESIKLVNHRPFRDEVTKIALGSQHYKLYVKEVVVHNRNGIFQLEATELIMPMIAELLQVIVQYAEMVQV